MKKSLFLILLISILYTAKIDKVQAIVFQTNLSYGLRGNEDVRELQKILIKKGFFTGSPTGNYLSGTRDAVKKFQKANGISPTGFAGMLTRKALSTQVTTIGSSASNPGSVPKNNSSSSFFGTNLNQNSIQPIYTKVPNQTENTNCLSSGICFDNRVLLLVDSSDNNLIDANDMYADSGITKYYSQNISSPADFLIVFKDWNPPNIAGAYSITINNPDSGMGITGPKTDNGWYGSKTLENLIIMPSIKDFQEQQTLNANISSFAHEIGHHWLAFFTDPKLFISDSQRKVHYTSCTIFENGNYSDLMMDGTWRWKSVADGIFSSPPPDNDPYDKKFSTLSLYVMGLIPKDSVQPFEIIRSPDSDDCSYSVSSTASAIHINGKAETITLDQLVEIYGERKPDFPNNQKSFTVQVAVLAHKDSKLTQVDADTFSLYLNKVEKYLPFAFSNKATFNFIRNTTIN